MHLEAPTVYFVHPVYWGSKPQYTRSYVVSTTKALSGREQRSLLNYNVRREFIYDVITRNQAESYHLKKYLKAYIHQVWGVPLWMYEMELVSQAASGQSILYLDSVQYRELQVGQEVLLYSDYKTFEVGEISSIEDSILTNLTGHYPLTSDYVDGSGNPLDLGSDEKDAIAVNGNTTITKDGANFIGNGDDISIPSRTYDIDGSNVSFVFWTNAGATTHNQAILGNSGELQYKRIHIDNEERIYVESDTDGQTVFTDTGEVIGGWHMFTIVFQSGTVTMWRDDTPLTLLDDTLIGDITIDRIGEDDTYFLEGNIQNIRIYEDRALTQANISTLYALGRNRIEGAKVTLDSVLYSTWASGTKVYPVMRSLVNSAQEFGAKVPEVFAINMRFIESFRGDSYA